MYGLSSQDWIYIYIYAIVNIEVKKVKLIQLEYNFTPISIESQEYCDSLFNSNMKSIYFIERMKINRIVMNSGKSFIFKISHKYFILIAELRLIYLAYRILVNKFLITAIEVQRSDFQISILLCLFSSCKMFLDPIFFTYLVISLMLLL